MLAAWRAHLQALGKPWLTHSHDLWQRFTRTYDHLRQQPRPVRRRVQRQWKASLAGAALALALLNAPAHAAAYTANDAASLIAAINNANADPAPDTITLTGDVTLTAADNGDTGPNGLPVITSVITLEGAGHTLARDATAPAFRLLAVKSTGDLTLNTLTLSNGYNSSSGSGSGSINGGGIFNQGRLTINNSPVSGNRVRVSGGGLYNKGTLTLNNSTVSGNTALARGGGLYNTGTLT